MIFLFGLPRSGTTWIGKLFDSHPETLYRHEPDSWGLLNSVPLLPCLNDVSSHGSRITNFCREVPGMTHSKVAGSTPMFAKAYHGPLRNAAFKANVFASKAIERFGVSLPVGSFVAPSKEHSVRLVWKSIESLGRLGTIARVVPNSHAVHIVRHPCGYVSSVLRGESAGKFMSGEPTSSDWELFRLISETDSAQDLGITMDRLKSMSPIQRLAARWVVFNDVAMRHAKGQSNFMLLKYEDVCLAPEKLTRELFDFAGLAWNEQTESFIRMSTTGSESDRYYSVIKDPVKSANKWQSELPAQVVSEVVGVVSGTEPGNLFFS